MLLTIFYKELRSITVAGAAWKTTSADVTFSITEDTLRWWQRVQVPRVRLLENVLQGCRQVQAPRTRWQERALCRWRQKRAPRTRSPEKLTGGVRQQQASWNVSWQIVSWQMRQGLPPLVRILRLLHLMLRQLGFVVVIVDGDVDLCSGSSGSSQSLWKVTSTCDEVTQTEHVIKKRGLALRCLVSPPSGSWSTSLDVCGFAQATRTCLAPSANKDKKRSSRCVLNEVSHSLPCRRTVSDAWRAAAAVDLCDGCASKLWIRRSVIADACKNCVRVLCQTQKTTETHAMTILCGKHTERWRETQPKWVMNADSNQGFAASPRQLGLVEKRIRLLAAAAATNRLVIEERTTTPTRNNECVLTSVSCVVAVAMLAWCPREHTRTPHIEDDWVQTEGALQPRLSTSCSRRRRARTCTETSRRARCRRRAPLWLDTKNSCSDHNIAMRVQCWSSCFTHHQCLSPFLQQKKKTKLIQTRKSIRPFSGIRGSFARSWLFWARIGGRNKNLRLVIIMAPMVPGHQRLDARQSPLGVSQHAKKKTEKNTLHISPIPWISLKKSLHVPCQGPV